MKLIDLDAVDDEEVEAIPVKWLEDSCKNSMDAQWHYAVVTVLRRWREERQEEIEWQQNSITKGC